MKTSLYYEKMAVSVVAFYFALRATKTVSRTVPAEAFHALKTTKNFTGEGGADDRT